MDRRLWEIDALRGVAVVSMVLYHFSYDLGLFGVLDLSFFTSGAGLWIGRSIGTTFILLVGISLTLSHARSGAGWGRYALRGARIFGYGLLITAVTLIVIPDEPIVFGILHLIGAAVLLSYPFLHFRLLNVALGLVVLVVGSRFAGTAGSSVWLAPFGIQPPFFMPDYWPLLPYFGVVLLGIAAGNFLYPTGAARPAMKPPLAPAGSLAFLGRHSLLIYLMHQPVLIGLLILSGVGSLDAL
jgi:uncharacterized membrane protein